MGGGSGPPPTPHPLATFQNSGGSLRKVCPRKNWTAREPSAFIGLNVGNSGKAVAQQQTSKWVRPYQIYANISTRICCCIYDYTLRGTMQLIFIHLKLEETSSLSFEFGQVAGTTLNARSMVVCPLHSTMPARPVSKRHRANVQAKCEGRKQGSK